MDIIDVITENHLIIQLYLTNGNFKASKLIDSRIDLIYLEIETLFELKEIVSIRNMCDCENCKEFVKAYEESQKEVIKNIRKIIVKNCN